METESSSRTSTWDDISLHVYRWKPRGDVKALVYISHGVGEYMGRYNQLGQVLADNGVLVFGHDHVGHGRSGGDRVHIETFSTYIRDVIEHIKEAKSEHPGIPCFLMGHSMGGLIAGLVSVEIQDILAGLIFSSPGFDVDPSAAGPVLKFFVRILGYVAPQFGIKSVDPSLISSIPEEVESYRTDPFVYHMPVKAKFSSEFLSAVHEAREKVNVLTKPVLIFHGTEDHLVPFSASEFLYSSVKSTDKTFEPFQGDFHEIFHDHGQERARKLVLDWIMAHKD